MKNMKYYLLFFGLIFILCYPILISGYFSDDSHDFWGESLSFWDIYGRASNGIRHFLYNGGRFFPLAFFYGIWGSSFFHTLISYKVYLCFLLILNVLIFRLILNRLLLVKLNFIHISLLIFGFFQIRTGHDAITAFRGLLMFVNLLLLISILFYLDFYKGKKKLKYFLSVLFFNLSLYTYELVFPLAFYFVFFSILNGKNFKERFFYPLGHLFSSALYFFLLLYLREYSGFSHDLVGIGGKTYSVSTNFSAIYTVFLNQLSGVLPLSFYLGDPKNIFLSSFSLLSKDILFILPVAFLAFFILDYATSRCPSFIESFKPSLNQKLNLLLFGLALFLVPSAFIAMISRFHYMIQKFLPYLGVFISYFGLCAIVFFVFSSLFKKVKSLFVKKFLRYSYISILSLILSFTLKSNLRSVEESNIYAKGMREFSFDSFEFLPSGFLDKKAVVIYNHHVHEWSCPQFFSWLNNKLDLDISELAFMSRIKNKEEYLQSHSEKEYYYFFTFDRSFNTPSYLFKKINIKTGLITEAVIINKNSLEKNWYSSPLSFVKIEGAKTSLFQKEEYKIQHLKKDNKSYTVFHLRPLKGIDRILIGKGYGR